MILIYRIQKRDAERTLRKIEKFKMIFVGADEK